MKNDKKVPLLVTTEHKGVFFGYGTPTTNKTIRIEQARMCVYWSADVKGVLGLAQSGPTKGCKITPKVPAITLQKVTSVTEATLDAAEAWEKGNWA